MNHRREYFSTQQGQEQQQHHNIVYDDQTIDTYPLRLLTGDAVPPAPPFSPGAAADPEAVTSAGREGEGGDGNK